MHTNTGSTDDTIEDVVAEKLDDAINVPGLEVEFDPHEADIVGAFYDDAVSLEDARAAAIDLLNT